MELAKRPKTDIERVILSRIDFTAAVVPEMMISAAYLKQLGLDERALAMYQQAARIAQLGLSRTFVACRLLANSTTQRESSGAWPGC